GRRADPVSRARPPGRCRAHRARDRASPRRREASRLEHRPGTGGGRGGRTRRGPGHSRERRPRRGVRDRPIPPGPHVMTGSLIRVLIVEDSASDAELMVRALRQGGFEIVQECVQTAEAMRAALARQSWDVVLSDYSLPHFDAPAALAVVRAAAPDVPFIVVSGSVGEDRSEGTWRSRPRSRPGWAPYGSTRGRSSRCWSTSPSTPGTRCPRAGDWRLRQGISSWMGRERRPPRPSPPGATCCSRYRTPESAWTP